MIVSLSRDAIEQKPFWKSVYK